MMRPAIITEVFTKYGCLIQVSKRNFTKVVKNLIVTSGTEQGTSGKSAVSVRLVINLYWIWNQFWLNIYVTEMSKQSILTFTQQSVLAFLRHYVFKVL